MTKTLEKTARAWRGARHTLSVPRTEQEYSRLVSMLDELLSRIGDREAHPLARLAETVAALIETYEHEHVALPDGDAIGALRALMAEHGLKQKDMKEIGSQGVVSEVLSGKRKLTAAQIRRLAKRFHVSPAVFID